MSDGFTSAGRSEGRFPSVYADSLQSALFSRWEQPILEERHLDYTQYLERDDVSPRSRAEAEQILGHLVFELAYREGIYGGTSE